MRKLSTTTLAVAVSVAMLTFAAASAPAADPDGPGATADERIRVTGDQQLTLEPVGEESAEGLKFGIWSAEIEDAQGVLPGSNGEPVYDLDDVTVHFPATEPVAIPDDVSWRVFGPAGEVAYETGFSFRGAGDPSLELARHTVALDGVVSTSTSRAPDFGEAFRYRDVVTRMVGATAPGRAVASSFNFSISSGNDNPLNPWIASYDLDLPGLGNRASGPVPMMWAFNNVGVYCFDLTSYAYLPDNETKITSDVETLRIVVGDWETWGEAECGAGPELPEDYYDTGDPLDPAINQLLPWSHSDISPRLDDEGNVTVGIHENWGSVSQWWDFTNTVVHIPDTVKAVVPEPGPALGGFWSDVTYLGEPGTEIWLNPESPRGDGPYLGYGGENFSASDFVGSPQWRLDSVTSLDGSPAPGEFVFGSSKTGAQRGGPPYFSTLRELPQSHSLPAGFHVHMSWGFTAPGTYCLGMTWEGIRADTGELTSTSRVMTVVVGGESYDPTSAPTCEQAQHNDGVEFVPGTPAVPVADGAPVRHVIAAEPVQGLSREDFAYLSPRLGAAGLEVTLVDGSPFGPGTRHAIDNVVIETNRLAAPPSQLRGELRDIWGSEARPVLGDIADSVAVDLVALDESLSGLDGPLTWQLGEVDGPGAVDISPAYDPWRLSTVPGLATSEVQVRTGTTLAGHWYFEFPGVYCLPFTFTGTRTDGSEVSVSHTLAAAAGVPAEDVQPGDDCVGSEPPEEEPDPDPEPEDPRPDSGRTVLHEGHIDVLSKLDTDALSTVIHDDAVTPAIDRVVEETTLAVLPEAELQLGPDPAYAFLGEAGESVWILPQTQQPDLLWPGWNLAAGGQQLTEEHAITWELGEVTGPGAFELFLSDGFGQPIRLLSSADTAHSSFTFNEHGHGNWAFTADGVYCVPMTATETVTGHSSSFTLLVAVGNLKPEKATEADCGKTAQEFNDVLPSGVSQSIVATIDDSDGVLVISVDPADRTVVMPVAELSGAGDRLISTGALRPVTVTDTRPGVPGWNASGQVGDFTGDTTSFDGSALGWTPHVLSQTDGQQVTPGDPVSPGFNDGGDGMSVARTLATAPDGAGRGTARLSAELTLELPTETPAGQYTATLTFTAI